MRFQTLFLYILISIINRVYASESVHIYECLYVIFKISAKKLMFLYHFYFSFHLYLNYYKFELISMHAENSNIKNEITANKIQLNNSKNISIKPKPITLIFSCSSKSKYYYFLEILQLKVWQIYAKSFLWIQTRSFRVRRTNANLMTIKMWGMFPRICFFHCALW